jgi:hypothetical protein
MVSDEQKGRLYTSFFKWFRNVNAKPARGMAKVIPNEPHGRRLGRLQLNTFKMKVFLLRMCLHAAASPYVSLHNLGVRRCFP